MEAAFCQEVFQQEMRYQAWENEPSAMIGPLFYNANADWLWHNHKNLLAAARLSPYPRTHAYIGMKMTILLFF